MKTHKIIQKAAFDMFRDWSKLAMERYPEKDFTIIDETLLVNDTKASIENALRSLFSEEYNEDRQNKGWCIGFVKGYIKGSLSEGWFHEYYQKQSDNYRNLIAVKSITEYFKVDSDISWRLDAIYKEFFRSSNLENIEFKTEIDVDFFNKYALTPQKGIVKQILDNISVIFIKNFAKETPIEFPDKDYFSNEEILFFIENRRK